MGTAGTGVGARAMQRKDTFALRVKGNSMIEMNIQDGDLVVIERTQHAANGETAVVGLIRKPSP